MATLTAIGPTTTYGGYTPGPIKIEGKTKIVYECGADFLVLECKDDVTAGNGKYHAVIPGKGEWVNNTTCTIFEMLKKAGIPVAFERQLGPTTFLAPADGEMVLLEVVMRGVAQGSYCKRNPDVKDGANLPERVYEWFLKTTGEKWGDKKLPCDDPLMILKDDGAHLYIPNAPFEKQTPFGILADYPLKGNLAAQQKVKEITEQVFDQMEKFWAKFGFTFVDMKLEFYVNKKGEVMVADEIGPDCWRMIDRRDGRNVDKERFRQKPEDVAGMSKVYEYISDIMNQHKKTLPIKV